MEVIKTNILGDEWTIQKLSYSEDKKFETHYGWCDEYTHTITYEDFSTDPDWDNLSEDTKKYGERETLRHETTHAFLFESGLKTSHDSKHWSNDEEIVDWIAVQGPKLYKLWELLDILPEGVIYEKNNL